MDGLPKGMTVEDLERGIDEDSWCDCCGRLQEQCICLECRECGQVGVRECYVHGNERGHGMRWRRPQLMGQAMRRLGELRAELVRLEEVKKEIAHIEDYVRWINSEAYQKQIDDAT